MVVTEALKEGIKDLTDNKDILIKIETMKTKDLLIVLAFLVLLGGLFYDPKDKDKPKVIKGAKNRPVSDKQLQKAFDKVRQEFGVDIARQTEQLYRKETRHFDSGQFKKTLTPGMEAVKGERGKKFPFGWGSLKTFLNKYPKYNGDFYLVPMVENGTGKTKVFVGFPTLEGAIMFVAYTIKKRGHAGLWRSFDKKIADRYLSSLLKYPVKFTAV